MPPAPVAGEAGRTVPATVVRPSPTPENTVRVVSATRKPPSGSAATACGDPSSAATVVMTPLRSTRRIRELPASAMRKPPSASGETPNGRLSCAADAGPPSPREPGVPVPATVVITPAGEMRRTRWFPESGKRMVPSASVAMPAALQSGRP